MAKPASRWYGFRHYFECPITLGSADQACVARVYSSEYDYYANTLRNAIAAPVFDLDGKAVLGAVAASWPADRTLGTLTFGPVPDSQASTSLLLWRDLDRKDAAPQLGEAQNLK